MAPAFAPPWTSVIRSAVPRFNTCDQLAPGCTVSSQRTDDSLIHSPLSDFASRTGAEESAEPGGQEREGRGGPQQTSMAVRRRNTRMEIRARAARARFARDMETVCQGARNLSRKKFLSRPSQSRGTGAMHMAGEPTGHREDSSIRISPHLIAGWQPAPSAGHGPAGGE